MNIRALLVGIACLFAANAWAADTIHVATAGTLSSLFESNAKALKLLGVINGTDIKFLREKISAGAITSLDLADVRIVKGGVAYNESYTTQNDIIGDYMFADLSKLVTVTLPTTAKEIGRYAFSKTGIKQVEVPNTVTRESRYRKPCLKARASRVLQLVGAKERLRQAQDPATARCLHLHGKPHDSRLFERAQRL